MAGLKDSLDELRAAWDALPEDKRRAAGDEATAAAFLAGNALRILKDHLPTLAGPAVAVGTRALTAHSLWRIPVGEIVGLIEAVFPELAKVLKDVAAALGFEEAPPAPPAAPAT